MTAEVPVAALPLAVKVRLLAVVAELGLNDAVTPLGRPEAVRFTLAAKPFRRAIVIELEVLNPWATVKLAGKTERLKSGGGFTVSETAAV